MTTDDHEIVLNWIHSTLTNKDWSAERWAREAGVAPTTLTRFMNHQTKYMPSWRTIAKLARAAHIDPPTLGTRVTVAGLRHLPLYYPDDIKPPLPKDSDHPHPGRYIVTDDTTGRITFAAAVTLDSYDARGVQAGDIVLCTDQVEQDRPVIAKIGNGFGVYRLSGDWLIPFSTQGHAPVPRDNAYLMGTVEEMKRRVD